MDKQKIIEDVDLFIAKYGITSLQGFTLGNRIHLEQKLKMLGFKRAPSKYELFFEIIDRNLGLDDALEVLRKYHYSFDYSKKFDLIIRYCIENEIYDKHMVNTILKHFIDENIKKAK